MWEDILKAGKRFFEIMKQNNESLHFLEYDSSFQFSCGENSFVVKVEKNQILEIKEGKHADELMDLTLISDEKTFLDLFKGRISPATSLYYGKLRIPAQKAKHSQIAALFQSMRKNQEDLYIKDWEQNSSE